MNNKLEEFIPIQEGKVNMYVCGPTVYDHPHIGNARPLVVFDTMKNYLQAIGYDVRFVSNYTDIDDRIIDKAINEGVDSAVISERYIEAYESLKIALNNGDIETIKVTDTVEAIVSYIEKLIDLGFAYAVDGDVYFRVNKIDSYGELSGQKMQDLMVGARIEESSKKENPLDFTLWKQTEVGVKYSSPWSQGRPGWHTECVVMIHDAFKSDKIDIHGGGMDLKFPHHENEIAQSCATDHNQIANYWVHNGMINFDGDKMSKSLGNVVLAKDLVAEHGGNVIRWFLQSAHYRAPLKYNDDMIDQAKKEVNRVLAACDQAYNKVMLEVNHWESDFAEKSYNDFIEAMADDFNTPNGYKVVFESVKKINQLLRQKEVNYKEIMLECNALIKMLDILGIKYDFMQITDDDISLYEDWNQAKADKNFELADRLRDHLSEKGLI